MNPPPEAQASLGTSALQSLRAFVGRGARVSGPITAICGIVSDLASTIGKFSLYLMFFSIATAIVSGLLWFTRYRRQYQAAAADGRIDAAELAQMRERNIWSILFAFSVVASVVMAGFVIAEKIASRNNRGVIASVVPGMDQVQDSLFRVEKKVDAVKEDTGTIRQDTATIRQDTAATRQDTARIAASVEEIAQRFNGLASNGGIIPNATTPEEHYHNARLHELGGNFAAARKEYGEFLSANLEVIDPWQSYAAMLKAQEGRTGALETIHYFGDKLRPRTLAYETTLALLEEGEGRLLKLQSLATFHPEYGPLAYLLAQEFSESKKGDQTLADQRTEKEWLEKFRDAQAAGHVQRYFLDKREAQKWLDQAETRLAKLNSTPAKVLENPVSLIAQQSSSGWSVTFTLTDYKMKELFYQLDGRGDFQSTGHLPYPNPQTGRPMVNPNVPLPNLKPGAHVMRVKYTDRNDQANGPYTLNFTTGDQQLAQGKMTLNATAGSWLQFRDFQGRTLLYFTGLMSYRPLLREVHYSINSEALDKTFKFKPSTKMFETGDDLYLAVPRDAAFACVEVTFQDGTKSAMQKIVRQH